MQTVVTVQASILWRFHTDLSLSMFEPKRTNGVGLRQEGAKLPSFEKNDREGHDQYYRHVPASPMATAKSLEEYRRQYESMHLQPFYDGGTTKGYVRGLATRRLIEAAYASNGAVKGIKVLDAGCGQGELSVYLACCGFTVVGVDVSSVVCVQARQLAAAIGVSDRCTFLAEDLTKLPLADASIHYVIGHAALHHFIKYDGVSAELARVLRPGGQGFFADAFGENKLYHLFHDKKKMQTLGDVCLTKRLVEQFFFSDFQVEILPTDWFVMLDKLFGKFVPTIAQPMLRRVSKLHFWLDRKVPASSRTALYLSGAVMTHITRKRPSETKSFTMKQVCGSL